MHYHQYLFPSPLTWGGESNIRRQNASSDISNNSAGWLTIAYDNPY